MSHSRILMLVGDYVEDTKSWFPSRPCRSSDTPRRRLPEQKVRRVSCAPPSTTSRATRLQRERGHNFMSTHLRQVTPETYNALVRSWSRAPNIAPESARARNHPPLRRSPQADRCHLPTSAIAAAPAWLEGRPLQCIPRLARRAAAGGTYVDLPWTRPASTATW